LAVYAIRAVRAAAPKCKRDEAGRLECQWQREQLPQKIRELVIDDESYVMNYASSYLTANTESKLRWSTEVLGVLDNLKSGILM